MAIFTSEEGLKLHNKSWHPDKTIAHKDIYWRFNLETEDTYVMERNKEDRPELIS